MPHDFNGKHLSISTSLHEAIDEVNLRILAALQQNSRVTMTELSQCIGISSSEVTERVRHLEQAGIIRGYCLTLNPAAIGLPLAAYIRIRPNPGQLPTIAEVAQQIPEVVECHRITGEDCFILKVHTPTIEQLYRLLDHFVLYGSTTTSIIQSSPVPPRPLPLPEKTLIE